MTTAKKDLTLIPPNPLLSFMMHMDPYAYYPTWTQLVFHVSYLDIPMLSAIFKKEDLVQNVVSP